MGVKDRTTRTKATPRPDRPDGCAEFHSRQESIRRDVAAVKVTP